MPTECNPDLFGFAPVEGRDVVAAFDGGAISSDAGALLLGAADRAIAMMDRFASCFHDVRCQELIEHEVVTLVGQRVFGIALGYEDLNDHDELRHDPMMAVLAGKLAARREITIENYIPEAGFFAYNHSEKIKEDENKELATQKYLTDGIWDLPDFTNFYNKLTDLYAFFLSLKKYVADDTPFDIKKRIKESFQEQPLRG